MFWAVNKTLVISTIVDVLLHEQQSKVNKTLVISTIVDRLLITLQGVKSIRL